ncbi:MAG: GNAT family N-acetyltransferase [Acidimicrobiia bacterium]
MKIRYEIDLPSELPIPTSSDLTVRTVAPSDLDGLAGLMLDAYRGTIDYEDETFEDAITEVQSFLDAKPSLAHSYLAVDGDEVASAVLVSVYEGEPFIGYVMTRPRHKNQRLGRHLVRLAMASLADEGHTRIALYITDGNTPSEWLFAGVGARPVDP